MDVTAQFVEAGAKLEGCAKEEFGAHGFEVLFFQSAFDPAEAGGESLELFFEGRDIFLLKLFELERFDDVDGTMDRRVRFPVEESGFWDSELPGDGAKAPAVRAHHEEGVFRFGGVHIIKFYSENSTRGRTSAGEGRRFRADESSPV